ncbi:MAG: hypothetical protein JXR77_09200 [Lentisphaeria bacterium]|nr:hypothetical protein [Lentisphaeria bacterium]
MIAVSVGGPHGHPLYDPVSHRVYATSAADVDLVLVAGRILVRDGRLRIGRPATALAQARAMAEGIRSGGEGDVAP